MQRGSASYVGGDAEDLGPFSLRLRMWYAKWLMVAAGILSFLGFLLIAFGLAQPFATISASYGLGFVVVDRLVAWGVGVVGIGVLLGFFGAAIKGPSREWSEVASMSPVEGRAVVKAQGFRYACPGCGGDVYESQSACPECGHALSGATTSKG